MSTPLRISDEDLELARDRQLAQRRALDMTPEQRAKVRAKFAAEAARSEFGRARRRRGAP